MSMTAFALYTIVMNGHECNQPGIMFSGVYRVLINGYLFPSAEQTSPDRSSQDGEVRVS